MGTVAWVVVTAHLAEVIPEGAPEAAPVGRVGAAQMELLLLPVEAVVVAAAVAVPIISPPADLSGGILLQSLTQGLAVVLTASAGFVNQRDYSKKISEGTLKASNESSG